MMWLDSQYPLDQDPEKPGIARGECEQHVGDPDNVESQHKSAKTVFSNIRFGPIDTTY